MRRGFLTGSHLAERDGYFEMPDVQGKRRASGFSRRHTVLEIVARVAIVAGAAFVVWKLVQPRPVFVIVIENGVARLKSGKVTAATLSDVATICRENGITRGRIAGHVRAGRQVALKFSREFSPGLQQQIRNCLV